MNEFNKIYQNLIKASINSNLKGEITNGDYDDYQLDCLLNPQKYAPVVRVEDCSCSEDEKNACAGKCTFNALKRDNDGNIIVDNDLCVGCSVCIDNCRAKRLTESKEIIPVLDLVYNSKKPVYALIAPAFTNQFSNDCTPGMLRTAFKRLGFAGMVEVALFADILTLKEAFEFDRNILKEEDFQLTSCCCPIWIAMIRKVYNKLVPHIPGSVSPMVACGRAIKALHEDAATVFVGPCIAKKAEAREKDVADAVDYVLTFQEIKDVFEFAAIDPNEMPEDIRDHSSRAGRIYAATGGVSEAVQNTVKRINPDRKITVKAIQADGVIECKKMLNDLLKGDISANFIEGMGCKGGCVGGPKVLIDREQGRKNVHEYGKKATYDTPIDNPYVIELLHRLGFDTVESLLEDSKIFTREF